MKKMKKIAIFLSLATASLAWGQDFELTGRVISPFKGTIYLKYGDKIDSTTVENQSFVFKGKIPTTLKANLYVNKDIKNTGNFILDPSPLEAHVVIENKRNVQINNLLGGKTTEKVKKFLIFRNQARDLPNASQIIAQQLKSMVEADPKNQVNAMLLTEVLSRKDISFEQGEKILNLIDKKYQEKQDIVRLNTVYTSLKRTQVGQVFPNIGFDGKNNKKVYLNSNKGRKYTLVYFASTTNITSVELDRKMVEIYPELKKAGLEVYEVYLDQSKEMWLSHIKKEKIPWQSTFEKEKFSSEQIRNLGIIEVPTNFLLDENGIIIETNIGPTKLGKKILGKD